MSEHNGNGQDILKVGKIGLRRFQYEESSEVVTVDVIHVSNLWTSIDRAFRDDKNEVPVEKLNDFYNAAVRFAAETLQVDEAQMSKASALHFLKMMDDEAEALKPFFLPKSAVRPDLPEKTEVTFSV